MTCRNAFQPGLLILQSRRHRAPSGLMNTDDVLNRKDIAMKRMMIATALATTIGTAGLAATEAEIQQVQSFDPSIDTTGFTDEQYDLAYGIVTSGESRSDQIAKLRALAVEDDTMVGMPMISEAEMQRLLKYAPDADLSTVTQAQAEMAITMTYGSESETEITRRVQSILDDTSEDSRVVVGQGVESLLLRYAPDADLTGLTAEELSLAMSYINSDLTRTETADRIQTLLN